jgi:AcrR family transcriptional regulator
MTDTTRSPERSQTARSDATRERILAAAAAILSVKGYSESRLADIAVAAGLRPPAVYYYFDSRDDLIAEVMRVGQIRVRKHVQTAISELPPGTEPIERIDAAVEAHLRVQLELSDFARAVTRNAGHVPPSVREALQRESEAYHSVWRELLHDARLAEQIRPDLDETIARMLVIGALNWATEWWTDGQPIEPLVANAQSLIHSALVP